MMEPRFLLDTETVIYIRRAQPEGVLKAFNELRPGETAISIITYGELVYGVTKSTERDAGLKRLEQIIQIIPVLNLPEAIAHEYGAIRAELEAAGRTIGNNDLWIAAHAMAAGMTLVTNNEKEFRRVRGLKIQNWAKK
jgi:tRNA(fMet)-specific endonuclease VapC